MFSISARRNRSSKWGVLRGGRKTLPPSSYGLGHEDTQGRTSVATFTMRMFRWNLQALESAVSCNLEGIFGQNFLGTLRLDTVTTDTFGKVLDPPLQNSWIHPCIDSFFFEPRKRWCYCSSVSKAICLQLKP